MALIDGTIELSLEDAIHIYQNHPVVSVFPSESREQTSPNHNA